MNWIKKNQANIILAIMSAFLTVLFVDIGLYFTTYRSHIEKLIHVRSYLVKDKEIGFDIAPNFSTTTHIFYDYAYPVWSNSLGCFDRNYGNEKPYIYLTGDSFTWGFTPFEEKWGTQIELLLGTRVLKCGVGGFGTKQELVKTTRDMDRLPVPDLIIVGYTQGNDIDDDANFPGGTVYNGYLVRNLAKNGVTKEEAESKYALFDKYCTLNVPSNPALQKVKCWFKNHSVVYNLVKDSIRKIVLSILPESILKKTGLIVQGEKNWIDVNSDIKYKEHLQNILGFKKLAQKVGSRLFFVLVPGENEKIKLFLDREGISYLDLNPIFKKYSDIKPLRWKVDGHWNIAGNRLVGFEVAKFLIEEGYIKVADREGKIKEINSFIQNEFGRILN